MDDVTGGGVSVAVVYDTGSRGHPALSGRTGVLAKAIARGAGAVDGTSVTLVHVDGRKQHWKTLDAADAIVFGCPTYMGSGSAAMKAFMEESLHPQFLEQRWKDKLAAGFTNSAGMSGDKLATLQQLAGFAAQHGMVWLSLGELPGWQDSSGSADDVNRLASFLGLMTQSNSDQGPDLVPPASDRATAHRFGRRIAGLTRRWVLGDNGRAAETAGIVLEAFAAVEGRNEQRLLELYHPQVEFHWPPSLPYGGFYGGARPNSRRSWREVWGPLQPTEQERSMSPRLVAAGGSEAVVLWRQRGLSPGGDRFDAEVLGLYEVRNGKFARAQMFYFDTDAVARFLDRAHGERARR